MSVRFTTLPCHLKIRLYEGMLELRGDWGVPENETDFGKDVSARRVKMSIDDAAYNLEAIAAFFTKEAEKKRRQGDEEEAEW